MIFMDNRGNVSHVWRIVNNINANGQACMNSRPLHSILRIFLNPLIHEHLHNNWFNSFWCHSCQSESISTIAGDATTVLETMWLFVPTKQIETHGTWGIWSGHNSSNKEKKPAATTMEIESQMWRCIRGRMVWHV